MNPQMDMVFYLLVENHTEHIVALGLGHTEKFLKV
jgi:hypothetical protein